MNVKDVIEQLDVLSIGVQHRDIEKSSLFHEASRLLKWYDNALYEEKRKVRELTARLEAKQRYP